MKFLFKTQTNMRDKALSGASWSVISQGVIMSMRLGSNIIIAKLLLPDAFGLMTLVNIFILGLFLLSDTGIETNIIRHQRGEDPDFYNTMWTIQIMRGVILSIMCLVLAGPFSEFYSQPMLKSILPVICILIMARAMESTSLRLKERHLHIRLVVLVEIIAYAISIVFMVVWTMISPTVWGLVLGNVLMGVVKTVISHLINLKEGIPLNRLKLEPQSVKGAISFGKWVFISTACSFFAIQADRIILGKLITIEFLGVYHIARQIIQIPFQVIIKVSYTVLYPMLSNFNRMENNIELVNKNLARVKDMLLPCMMWLLLVTIIAAKPFFHFLYKTEYHGAIHLIPYLAILIWFDSLISIADRLPLMNGKTEILATSSSISLIMKSGLSITGYHFFQIQGLIIGLAVGSLISYMYLVLRLKRDKIKAAYGDLKYTAIFVISVGLIMSLDKVPSMDQYYLSFILSVVFIVAISQWVFKKAAKGIKLTKDA